MDYREICMIYALDKTHEHLSKLRDSSMRKKLRFFLKSLNLKLSFFFSLNRNYEVILGFYPKFHYK